MELFNRLPVGIMDRFSGFHLYGGQCHTHGAAGKEQPDQYGDKDAQQHGCDYEQNLSGINFSHVICF